MAHSDKTYPVDYRDIRIVKVYDKLPVHDKSNCYKWTEVEKEVEVYDKKLGKKIKEKKKVKQKIKSCSGIRSYADRSEWEIKKILIHHHAGAYGKTHKKRSKKGDKDFGVNVDYRGAPEKLIKTAKFFIQQNNPYKKGSQGRHWHGYAYHYDIPYYEEIQEGKRIVYLTQDPLKISNHTGAGHNRIGVSISLIGFLRNLDHPFGAKYSKNEGKPSAHQLAVIPQLVEYLQKEYDIANCHVQGHFQHGKHACPGFDFEKWIMEYEEKARHDSKAFCYPLNLSGGSDPPFLKELDKEKARCKEYILNTHQNGSGYYPISRRFQWHNGVHLFPKDGAGSPVYCVRDGWVIAARLNGKVEVDGINYGSSTFVLIMHEDPGLFDPLDRRSFFVVVKKKKKRIMVRHLLYYSCYMHLKPLGENLEWVKKLKKRDPKRFDQMNKNSSIAYRFSHRAIPVKAGEVIGCVGQHKPFASRSKKLKVMKPEVLEKDAFLHFEMFSKDNLLQYFDDDEDNYKAFTILDPDLNALADDATIKLKKLDGFSTHISQLESAISKANKADSKFQDPSQWQANLNDELVLAMSRIVSRHVSEWRANWTKIFARKFKLWGLTKKKANSHAKNVLKGFLWWNDLTKGERGYPNRSFLTRNQRPYYYHPIRLLNWLHGLERKLDGALSGKAWVDLPITAKLTATVEKDGTKIKFGPNVKSERLDGGLVRFPGSKTVHDIKAVQRNEKTVTKTVKGKKVTKKRTTGYTLTIAPGVTKQHRAKTTIKLGRWGWQWKSRFTWETEL